MTNYFVDIPIEIRDSDDEYDETDETYVHTDNKKCMPECAIDYHEFRIGGKIMKPTEEQYKIITEDPNKNMLVLACAGSGKSTTMVCRVKYLIDHGVKPERIILTTFNVDACESLKNKLGNIFGDVPNVMVGTFDSISCRMYHKYFKKDYFVGISEYTTEFYKYLETPDGMRIMKRYDYVIFDEFQDVSDSQYNIVKKFYEHGVKIILIGDDAQNIYQWRGSDLKYILKARDYFPTIETYLLSTNYRSSTEIVTLANAIIANNKDNIVKPMNSFCGSSRVLPQIKYYFKVSYQSQDVVNTISSLIQRSVEPCDIAVIARNNFPLKDIEEEIERHNKSSRQNIKYISLITNDGCDMKPKINNECVTLTTIHKSKGLEWKYVFIVSCNDEMLPSNIDPVGIQEERRLFYVAITRAKTFLNMSFTGRTITRFINEIDRKLYMFQGYNKKYFQYSNSRTHKTENELNKVIGMLTTTDIDEMRCLGVIPNISPEITKIHEGRAYTENIDKMFLHNDFNNFITRYVLRKIGDYSVDKFGISLKSCYRDPYADAIINSVAVSRTIYNANAKYANVVEMCMHLFDDNDTDDDIIHKMSMNGIHIDAYDTNSVVALIKFKRDELKKHDEQREVMLLPDHYLPDDYIEDLNCSYNTYIDTKKDTEQINNIIYDISLCENICNGRRRMVYQNAYNDFVVMLTYFSDNIKNEFIPNNISDGVMCNKHINVRQLDIKSDVHILNAKQHEMINICCSSERECKLEWLLGSLAKVAMIRYINSDEQPVIVNTVKIYNPIHGTMTSFDVSMWTGHVELLKRLCSVRGIPYSEANKSISNVINATQVKQQETRSNNDEHNNKNEYSQTVGAIHEPAYDVIHRLVTITNECDKFVNEFRQFVLTTCGDIKNNTRVNDNEKMNDVKYIVFDTETTGLPKGYD